MNAYRAAIWSNRSQSFEYESVPTSLSAEAWLVRIEGIGRSAVALAALDDNTVPGLAHTGRAAEVVTRSCDTELREMRYHPPLSQHVVADLASGRRRLH